MPATDSENTPATQAANAPAGLKKPGLLAYLWTWESHGRRICVWLIGAAVVTSAMGSAANHFLNGRLANDEASGTGKASGGSSGVWSGANVWWNPNSAPDSGPSSRSTASSRAAAPSAPTGASVIPVEQGLGFSSGSLTLNGTSPIGVNSSSEAYLRLGLGTRSGTGSPGGATMSTTFSSSTAELHFSMSGDLNRVPVDNLAAGGLSLNLAAVPEPTTALMLAVGLAGLAFKRHRPSESKA